MGLLLASQTLGDPWTLVDHARFPVQAQPGLQLRTVRTQQWKREGVVNLPVPSGVALAADSLAERGNAEAHDRQESLDAHFAR